ncbi:hypothetical protein Niako_1430 [Niastella koreensis GR20-10]|uniref:Uncharacterized protein n=1 Tax=Niastella koreensis (strain DSM 17620 / KACC 11465 / NBRC 106392 / GR20-10) TaxID=700598 RepID=G8TPI0_NIAKG|nr:hypothetical protein Niako_1430 [Niastella koreensis GR20-10]
MGYSAEITRLRVRIAQKYDNEWSVVSKRPGVRGLNNRGITHYSPVFEYLGIPIKSGRPGRWQTGLFQLVYI